MASRGTDPSPWASEWRTTTLLNRLSAPVRDEMIRLGAARSYEPGDVLIRQGGTSREALLLLSGLVKVKAEDGHTDVLLTVRGAGDVVGDLAALSGQARSATVTAGTAVVARFILPDTLREFLRRHPQAAELLNALMVDQLMQANRRRVEFATMPVMDRLISVILELVAICGDRRLDGSVHLPPVFSQSEWADLVGAASEDTVQRCLRNLRSAGLVTPRYKFLVVEDPGRLRAEQGRIR